LIPSIKFWSNCSPSGARASKRSPNGLAKKRESPPLISRGRREAAFRVDSELAHIDLRFTVFTDQDVRNVVFYYDLEIIPILMKFDSHSEIEFPLEAVNSERLEEWMDDRILSFVETYLSLQQNAYYQKGHLVQDPVAHVQFPKSAAGEVADFEGKTYYFVSEDTCREYAQTHGIPASK
jgi:YHS domain-containing protein